MGLFDIFKKPKTIQDDFFGILTFIWDQKKSIRKLLWGQWMVFSHPKRGWIFNSCRFNWAIATTTGFL